MQIFRLKKGGKEENPEEVIVMLNRQIDKDLLIKAINKKADENATEETIIQYIDDNFKAIYCIEKEIETFYY